MASPPPPHHATASRRRRKRPLLILSILVATINVATAMPTRLRSRISRELGTPPMYEPAPAPPADREQMVEGSGVALGTRTSTTGEKYVVQTECGLIRSGYFVEVGHRDMDEKEVEGQNTTVVPFYGIRYAAPLSTNATRWTSPRAAPCPMAQADSINSSSDWVYDAGDWKEGCVQPDGKSGVEDCLYLNIFTPLSTLRALEPPCLPPLFPPSSFSSNSILGGVACNNSSSSSSSSSTERTRGQKQAIPSSAAALLPVVVYLHGGGLMEGSSKKSPLAGVVGDNRFGPVVGVSLDYRLNIFGFLVLQDLSQKQGGVSGNYGLQDQQEALRWIQKNIHHFGGDPKRITLIGHSSGGTSIFALLSSPASVGLFHGAISLSGSPNITMSLPQAHAQNQPILDATPCATLHTPALRLDCLRGLPASILLGLMPPSWSTPGIFDLPKGPEGQEYGGLPVVDGKTLTHSFLNGLEAGVVDVPLIISSMGNEVDCCTMRDVRNFTTTQWEDLLATHFTPWGGEKIGRTIASFYAEEAAESPQKALTALISDIGVMCGSSEAASRAATGGKRRSPIYLLINEWGPSTPLPRGTQLPPSAYAFHGWDNTNWMRDYPSLPPSLPSSSDLAHSRWLRQMVWSFANGNGGGWVPAGGGGKEGKDVGVYVLEPPMVEGGREGGVVIGYKKEVCAYFREVGIWETSWWVN